MPKVAAKAPLEIEVTSPDIRDLLRRAKAFEPRLATALRRNLRTAGKIAVQAVQDEVQTGWPKGKQHTGLRAGIARGVGVDVSTGTSAKRIGVFVVASGKGLPANQKALVRKINRDTFKHPVFGNKTSWVVQRGHLYFDRPIAAKAPKIQSLVEDAMDEALKAMTT